MKSVWFSIRAFVTAFVIVVFGGALVYMAVGQGSEGALGVIGTSLGVIITFYFASPTGSGGQPHSPTT